MNIIDNKNPNFKILRLFITYNPVEIEQSKKLISNYTFNIFKFLKFHFDRTSIEFN